MMGQLADKTYRIRQQDFLAAFQFQIAKEKSRWSLLS